MSCYFTMDISIWYFIVVLFPEPSIGSNLCPCRNLKEIEIDLHPYDRNLPESTLVCCNVSSLKQIGDCHAKTNIFDAEKDEHDSVLSTHLIIERSPKLEGNFSLELFLKTLNISPSVNYIICRIIFINFLAISNCYFWQYYSRFITWKWILIFIFSHLNIWGLVEQIWQNWASANLRMMN